MGFESYFTLYRKYNTKATAKEIKDTIAKYVKDRKSLDYSDEKKSDEEYEKDIPVVLDPNFGEHGSVYNEKTKEWEDKTDNSTEGQRRDFKFILSSDGSNLDELLYWYFCSNFNCLCDKYALGHGYKNDVIITRETAEKMLQACRYLLSGKYDDDFENILDNEWIDILANGNSGNSYWPYTYRKNKKVLKEMEEEEREEIGYVLKKVANALETYLNTCTRGEYENNTELILVYSISY